VILGRILLLLENVLLQRIPFRAFIFDDSAKEDELDFGKRGI